MPDLPELGADGGAAVRVAVYATLMYDIISATNSSPQTTEINAARRGPTLMKWVHLGLLQGALFVAIGVLLDPDRWPPLLGGTLAGGLLYLQYRHALDSGTESPGAGTEDAEPMSPIERGVAWRWAG